MTSRMFNAAAPEPNSSNTTTSMPVGVHLERHRQVLASGNPSPPQTLLTILAAAIAIRTTLRSALTSAALMMVVFNGLRRRPMLFERSKRAISERLARFRSALGGFRPRARSTSLSAPKLLPARKRSTAAVVRAQRVPSSFENELRMVDRPEESGVEGLAEHVGHACEAPPTMGVTSGVGLARSSPMTAARMSECPMKTGHVAFREGEH